MGASLNGHEDSQQSYRSSGPRGRVEIFVDSARAEEHLMCSSCEPGLDRAKISTRPLGPERMQGLCTNPRAR